MSTSMTQEQILLRAAHQLLKKVGNSYYVLNVLEQTSIWHGAECDGGCHMEDIEALLNEQEVDLDLVGLDLNLPENSNVAVCDPKTKEDL